MQNLQKISPFLWFNTQAEEAANFYVGIFKNSKIITATRYNKESAAVSGQKEGSVMTIGFQLEGQNFAAINGGPHFKFTEAISLVVNCETQQEVDYYWEKLGAGGDPKAQQCGWLKDKFGVSWQIVPIQLPKLLNDPDAEKAVRVAQVMMKMKKLDIAALERA
ncbi:MAG TPA: VOC family protein [Spongiibacteraceae bacterium]|nr:VOC family protein [Spongiibacteraceae bacterium]